MAAVGLSVAEATALANEALTIMREAARERLLHPEEHGRFIGAAEVYGALDSLSPEGPFDTLQVEFTQTAIDFMEKLRGEERRGLEDGRGTIESNENTPGQPLRPVHPRRDLWGCVLMAGVAMHPKPAPVILSSKVARAIATEASLDIDWEGMHEDRPEALIATYERIGGDIAFIRLLLSGELTEASAVLRAQGIIRQECDRVAAEIGGELLRLDRFKGDEKVVVDRREVKKRVKGLRKQAKRLWAASRDCSRFWEESKEYDADQEAAERMGLGGGGEG